MGKIVNRFDDGKGIVRLDENGIVMSGDIDSVKSGLFLKSFFDNVLSFIGDSGSLSVNIKSLHFINSLGIKAIVQWICTMKRMRPEVKIVFLINKNLSWQDLSIKPLIELGLGTVSVISESIQGEM